MRKLITTFLICFCVLPIMAQDAPVEPNVTYCVNNNKIYTAPTGGFSNGRPIYRQDTYRDLPPDGIIQISEQSCLQLTTFTSRCVIPNVTSNAFTGRFSVIECPIDSYIIPLGLIVIGFSITQIRKRLV